jgi:pantoate--beta-alanine ligase
MTRAPVRCVAGKDEVRRAVRGWREAGHTVGVVMTMGALHQGHLSLVEEAARACDRVVVTIYVNPLQFGPDEDYEGYPRDLAGDLDKLEGVGCDLAFAPPDEELFPDGPGAFRTRVEVGGMADVLCGADRPGHFDGMATEVTKQLLIVDADFAFFGEKDFQQLRVIERLVEDLGLPVRIVGLPVSREPDGLAYSSRNAYLDARRRRQAPALYRCLVDTAATLTRGGVGVEAALAAGCRSLLRDGFDEVDYLKLVDARSLAELDAMPREEARLVAAARIGPARLIDNVPVVPGAGS